MRRMVARSDLLTPGVLLPQVDDLLILLAQFRSTGAGLSADFDGNEVGEPPRLQESVLGRDAPYLGTASSLYSVLDSLLCLYSGVQAQGVDFTKMRFLAK